MSVEVSQDEGLILGVKESVEVRGVVTRAGGGWWNVYVVYVNESVVNSGCDG